MNIYKIASVDSDMANLKDTIRSLKDDIRDLKRDNKETMGKVKKIDNMLERLNIGNRQVTQMQTTFTGLQRKVEKFEVLLGEWKNYKKEMDDATLKEVERRTKGQVKAFNMKIYKIARLDGIYNIYLITSSTPERILKDVRGNVIEIKADSSEQARKFALDRYTKLREWNNEYAGRSIVARLNKGKVQEIEKYKETIGDLRKQKEERAQGIYD